MKRIDHPTNATTLVDEQTYTPNDGGFFKEGNKATGIPPTTVTGNWLNGVQEEIIGVIEAAGLTPSNSELNQMATAIQTMIDESGFSIPVYSKAADYTIVAADKAKMVDCTGTINLTLTEAATLGNGWIVSVRNSGGGTVTVTPSNAQTIDGKATLQLGTGQSVLIVSTGTGFYTIGSAGDSNPVGSLLMFPGTTPPAGYLACSGQAVNRATYPQLDAAIYCGDSKNATALSGYRCTDPGNPTGTRSTTGQYLVLPDYRGEFLRGWDNGRGVDAGRGINTWQADEFKSHFHTATQLINGSGSEQIYPTAGTGSRTNQTNATGGTETRPRNIAVLVCIKAFSALTNQALIDITALANDVSNRVPFSAFTGSNQSITSNGYQKLPGGLIIVWGSYAFNHTGAGVITQTVNLPISFPNGVLLSWANSTTSSPLNFGGSCSIYSASQIQLWSQSVGAGTPSVKYWALGY